MAMSKTRKKVLSNPIVRTVLSMWSWLMLGIIIIVWVPLVGVVRLATAPFDKGAYKAGYLFRKLAVVHRVLNPLWTFRTSGVQVSDPRRPYVVVANHESFVDMLLISQLPWEMKWLAKEDFFKYPLVGWLLRFARDIRLVRGQKSSIVQAMDSCKERLSHNVSVMIFPEGTRTRDGHLQAFKTGAFRLAIETGTPILPLALHGTYSALQKGDWRFGIADAEVRVLAPVETTGMTLDDVDDLRDRVHALIAAAVDELRLTSGA